jgi:hypothetical protein
MTERAYTLTEIDRLRSAARVWYSLYSNLDAKELEERVRTFMIAGTDPGEIERGIAERKRMRERSR